MTSRMRPSQGSGPSCSSSGNRPSFAYSTLARTCCSGSRSRGSSVSSIRSRGRPGFKCRSAASVSSTSRIPCRQQVVRGDGQERVQVRPDVAVAPVAILRLQRVRKQPGLRIAVIEPAIRDAGRSRERLGRQHGVEPGDCCRVASIASLGSLVEERLACAKRRRNDAAGRVVREGVEVRRALGLGVQLGVWPPVGVVVAVVRPDDALIARSAAS